MKNNLLLLILSLFSIATSAQKNEPPTHCNNIECITEHYKTLTSVSLVGKNITSLPEELWLAQNLLSLSIANTNIRKISPKLSKLPHLNYLSISGNARLSQESIFQSIANTTSISELNLNNNNWHYFSKKWADIPTLKKLDLSKNYLETVPSEIFSEIGLERIDLSSNRIKELPAAVQLCGTLQSINLKYNSKLDVILVIHYLSNLSKLKELRISNVSKESGALKQLQQLKKLEISGGKCKNVFEDLSTLKKLEALEINYPSRDLKKKEILYLNDLKKLNQLTIKSVKLVDLSHKELNLSELEQLNLSGNELIIGGIDTTRFAKLTNFSIKNSNVASQIPSELVIQIPELRTLELVNCTGVEKIKMNAIDSLKDLNTSYSGVSIQAKDFNPEAPIVRMNLIKNNITEADVNQLKRLFPISNIKTNPPTKPIANDVVMQPKPIILEGNKNRESFTYKPEKPSTIETYSGYKIDIPIGAFVDANGNQITEPVELEITTFDNPVQMAVQGIPMAYEEGGELKMFSSSSMFRVTPKNSDSTIFINPDARIEVTMPVERSTDTLYSLDESTGTWSKLDRPNLRTFSSTDLANMVGEESTVSLIQRPVRPQMPTRTSWYQRLDISTQKERDRDSFTFSVFPNYNSPSLSKNMKKFKQTRNLKRFVWHYDGENSADAQRKLDSLSRYIKRYYTKKKLKGTSLFVRNRNPSLIRGIELIPQPEKDNFNLVLKFGNENLEIPCYPESNPNNPDIEAKKISRFYNSYKRSDSRIKRKWAKTDKRYNALLVEYEKKYAQYSEKMEEYLKLVKERGEKLYRVKIADSIAYMNEEELRASNIVIPVAQSFSLMGFGTFNCDVIYRFQEPVEYKGDLVAENGQILDVETVSILDQNQNGVIHLNWKNRLTFDNNGATSIIAKLKSGKIAYISSSSLSEINFSVPGSIPMKIIDNKSLSIAELEELL